MTKFLTTIFVFMISLSAFSQERDIKGKVMDKEGIPLAGATLIIKGTNKGTTTDFDGLFTLETKTGDILEISYVGMKKQTINVGQSSTLNITMEEDAAALDEVIVIGYGTVKKTDLTGSVAVVDTKEAFVSPTASVQDGLQGRASGVQVTSNGGAPGTTPTVVIRGGNSITGGNGPLYVVDGYVGAGNIGDLNPNDIETMQVLKDASATAIYGARGTNGVVLITTKQGKIGKPTVNLKVTSGLQRLPNQLDVQTPRELAAWQNSIVQDQDNLPFDLDNLPGGETNWQDVMTRTASISEYQLSVSGGTENTKYFLSTGYLDQEGIIKGSEYQRYSLRSNVSTNISKVFKVGVNLLLSRTERDNNDISFQNLLREDPSKPVYGDDGAYYVGFNPILGTQTDHLLANAELNQNDVRQDKAFVNTFVQASILDNLTITSTLSADVLYSTSHSFVPSTNPSKILNNNQLASGSIATFYDVDYLNENTVHYNEIWGNHSIDVVSGITFQTHHRNNSNTNASNIPSDGVGVNSLQLAPAENVNVSSGYTEDHLIGMLARVNYSFKDRYLLTASIRRDGSSRLGVNERWENFPSVGLGWKIKDEPWMQNANAINNFKLRASYGKTGNQGANPFVTIANVGIVGNTILVDGVRLPGVQQGQLAKPDLGWEITNQFDAGLELGMFNNRFSADVDVYYKKTENLLLNEPQLAFTGVTSQLTNIGEVENKGIDVTLSGVLVRSDNFEWDASLTISHNKNEVLDLGQSTFIETNRIGAPANDRASELRVGQPVGIFVGAIYDGFDPATGEAIFRDISGPDGVPDGEYTAEYDDTVIGDANPDVYGGFQTNFRLGNFDLSAFFTFSVGNENYNEEFFRVNEPNVNSFAGIREGMWTAQNPDNARYPGFSTYSYNRSSSLYLQDASYLRLTNLQLGYTLPTDLIKGFNKFRMYVTGTNLLLVKSDDYLGFDPDVNTSSGLTRGFDAIGYPQNRSFLFGIDVTF
ncbi:SusC/RagA family TonB-linked outer membrane protein [Formosa haliotis]|uniref:SusC/RagA family TonB-linked outer membrane protein n=1 Tax=Formosa haliotis TaxID=1555194 RepID=UPI0008241DAD|nr:TonB-dependent receptor [Formosa haliotis]